MILGSILNVTKRKTKSEKRITISNNQKGKAKKRKMKNKKRNIKKQQLYLALQKEFGRLGLIQIMHSPKVIGA